MNASTTPFSFFEEIRSSCLSAGDARCEPSCSLLAACPAPAVATCSVSSAAFVPSVASMGGPATPNTCSWAHDGGAFLPYTVRRTCEASTPTGPSSSSEPPHPCRLTQREPATRPRLLILPRMLGARRHKAVVERARSLELKNDVRTVPIARAGMPTHAGLRCVGSKLLHVQLVALVGTIGGWAMPLGWSWVNGRDVPEALAAPFTVKKLRSGIAREHTRNPEAVRIVTNAHVPRPVADKFPASPANAPRDRADCGRFEAANTRLKVALAGDKGRGEHSKNHAWSPSRSTPAPDVATSVAASFRSGRFGAGKPLKDPLWRRPQGHCTALEDESSVAAAAAPFLTSEGERAGSDARIRIVKNIHMFVLGVVPRRHLLTTESANGRRRHEAACERNAIEGQPKSLARLVFGPVPRAIVRKEDLPVVDIHRHAHNALRIPARTEWLTEAVVTREPATVTREGELLDAVIGLRAPTPGVLIITDTNALVAIASEQRIHPPNLRPVQISFVVQRHLIVPASGREANAVKDHRGDDAGLVCVHDTVAVEAASVGSVLALKCRECGPCFKHLALLASHACP
eukprot:7391867-Prymnesium_polylepis.5